MTHEEIKRKLLLEAKKVERMKSDEYLKLATDPIKTIEKLKKWNVIVNDLQYEVLNNGFADRINSASNELENVSQALSDLINFMIKDHRALYRMYAVMALVKLKSYEDKDSTLYDLTSDPCAAVRVIIASNINNISYEYRDKIGSILLNDSEISVLEKLIENNYELDIFENIDQNELFNKLGYYEKRQLKIKLIKQNVFLDKFMDDPDEMVRAAVAGKGYAADILCHDKSIEVRKAVALAGCALEVLIDDEFSEIRAIAMSKNNDLLNTAKLMIEQDELI